MMSRERIFPLKPEWTKKCQPLTPPDTSFSNVTNCLHSGHFYLTFVAYKGRKGSKEEKK